MFWRVQIAAAVVVQLDNFAYTHPYSSVEHHIGVAAERPAGSMVVVRCDEAIAERCDLVWKETKDHLRTFQPRSCGCDLCLGNPGVPCLSRTAIAAGGCGRQGAGSVYDELPVALFRSNSMKLHHVL